MAYDVSLCNSKGETMLGSDGNFNVDKRLASWRIKEEVREYRERFRKNFPHKAEYWTHFLYKGDLIKI